MKKKNPWYKVQIRKRCRECGNYRERKRLKLCRDCALK